MHIQLRPLQKSELAGASELCLRSKAHWGYDAQFLAACREELTLHEAELATDPIIVAEDSEGIAGIAHVACDKAGCYLDKLFIEPDRIGKGVGRALYLWALDAARALGAHEMIIEADPDAALFYEKMGATAAGQLESSSVPGRFLPRFVHRL